MKKSTMTSMQRVLASLSHKEPDRVPFFFLLTMHGARELELSIHDYFAKAEHVAEGQLRLRAKFGHDCLYSFFTLPWKSRPGAARLSMPRMARPIRVNHFSKIRS
ncbi:MAG: uroporphyrinogen decarboxylase family protein [Smithellaceae bacterium]|nr:uroporphyrinogen decarboxylase family protein [Smithellaceae bacterium]